VLEEVHKPRNAVDRFLTLDTPYEL